MIRDVLHERGATGHQVIDIRGGYGIFAEEYQRIAGGEVTVSNPVPIRQRSAVAKVCGLSKHSWR